MQSKVAGTNFRFVSTDPAALVFAGGNNEGGVFRFRDQNGVDVAIPGTISRRSQGALEALYFVEAGAVGNPRAFLFVVPGAEATVEASEGTTFATNSAGVTAGLNALLGLQPRITSIVDDVAGGPIAVGDTVTYAFTFQRCDFNTTTGAVIAGTCVAADTNDATFTEEDLGNAGNILLADLVISASDLPLLHEGCRPRATGSRSRRCRTTRPRTARRTGGWCSPSRVRAGEPPLTTREGPGDGPFFVARLKPALRDRAS